MLCKPQSHQGEISSVWNRHFGPCFSKAAKKNGPSFAVWTRYGEICVPVLPWCFGRLAGRVLRAILGYPDFGGSGVPLKQAVRARVRQDLAPERDLGGLLVLEVAKYPGLARSVFMSLRSRLLSATRVRFPISWTERFKLSALACSSPVGIRPEGDPKGFFCLGPPALSPDFGGPQIAPVGRDRTFFWSLDPEICRVAQREH